MTFFATLEGGAWCLGKEDTPKLLPRLSCSHPDYQLRFTTRGSKLLDLPPTEHPVHIGEMGGAGNKSLRAALGHLDCYLSQGLDFWDICGAEVIVRAVGGHVTDFKGEPIRYIEGVEGTGLREGVVVTQDVKVFERVRRFIKVNH